MPQPNIARPLSSSLRPLRLLAAASVAVPLALFALAAWQSYSRQFRDAERLVERTTDLLAEHTRRVFETHQLVLDRFDERIRGIAWPEIEASEQLHRALRDVDDKLEQIDGIWLIDAQARGRASSRFFPVPASSYVPDRDYFRALQQQDVGVYVGRSYSGRSTPEHQFFNIARRRSTPDGSFDGVIVTSLKPDYFGPLYKALVVSPDDAVSVVRADGAVLARGPGPVTQASMLDQASGFMRNIGGADRGLYRTTSQVDGIERIYGFRKLAPYAVYVAFGRSVGSILAQWRQELLVYGAVALATMLALLAVTAMAMRRARQEQEVFARWLDSEARYETLFRQSATGLLLSEVRDDRTFVLEEINPALSMAVGIPPEKILGRTPLDAFPGELGRTMQQAYERCVASRQPVEYEAAGLGPAGPFVRRVVVMPVLDREGRVRKLLGNSMNITETRRLEEQVRQMQKIEAIGQLTGGVAHDFNNLLMAVIGNLDLLRKRLPDDDRARRYLDGALQGAQRGASLTQRLLAFARRQDLQTQAVDVPMLVHGVKDLLERSLGPLVEIRYRLAPDLPPAKVDPNQLELALLNLAVNARDAMPLGGALAITVDAVDHGTDEPYALPPGRYLRLRVVDTGTGMDEATLKRAVEPFFSTKGVGKGTGLGLSMVYGLAAQSGGTLRLHSSPGQGTTAELWLPCADAAPDAVQGASAAVRAAPPSTILVVDDDLLILTSTASMLEDLGHTVIEAGSAAGALEILQARPTVDLLITDFAMPEMNGLELAAVVRDLRPDLPMLLATGYADLPAGAAPDLPRLPKPYTQDQLAEQIAGLLGRQASASDANSMWHRGADPHRTPGET